MSEVDCQGGQGVTKIPKPANGKTDRKTRSQVTQENKAQLEQTINSPTMKKNNKNLAAEDNVASGDSNLPRPAPSLSQSSHSPPSKK